MILYTPDLTIALILLDHGNHFQGISPYSYTDLISPMHRNTYDLHLPGSGTEWIDDVQVEHTRLGSEANRLPDTQSGLFTDETSIEIASCFDVVLLKGTLWQGNTAQGAIHRSPATTPSDNPRILLVIDALWD